MALGVASLEPAKPLQSRPVLLPYSRQPVRSRIQGVGSAARPGEAPEPVPSL